MKTSVKISYGICWLLAAIFAHNAFAVTNERPKELTENSEGALSDNLDQQILLIDVEILLLKAELARKNGERQTLKNYLSQIQVLQEGIKLSSSFQQRLNALKTYLATVNKSDKAPTSLKFQFAPENVVALLPVSGPYESVGNEIAEGLRSELQSAYPDMGFKVIDTHLYNSMFELWEWIQLYQPSFIFGPLDKQNADDLLRFDPIVSTLILNDVSFDEKSPFASLTLHSDNYSLERLIDYIEKNQYNRIVVLHDETKSSLKLLNSFQEMTALRSTESNSKINVQQAVVRTNVDKTVDSLVNTLASQARKNWLQKTIDKKLVFEERSRKDLEFIVSFLPFRLAMQVSPLLTYYHLNSVTHFWVPSKLPNMQQFVKSLPFWQQTLSVFPYYYVQSILSKQERVDTNFEVGIFYALGELAAKIALNPNEYSQVISDTSLGKLNKREGLHWYFAPEIYWLDMGVFESVTP